MLEVFFPVAYRAFALTDLCPETYEVPTSNIYLLRGFAHAWLVKTQNIFRYIYFCCKRPISLQTKKCKARIRLQYIMLMGKG